MNEAAPSFSSQLQSATLHHQGNSPAQIHVHILLDRQHEANANERLACATIIDQGINTLSSDIQKDDVTIKVSRNEHGIQLIIPADSHDIIKAIPDIVHFDAQSRKDYLNEIQKIQHLSGTTVHANTNFAQHGNQRPSNHIGSARVIELKKKEPNVQPEQNGHAR